jgi:hypothetical protein
MAADQFDLVCSGDSEPWRYRVDLAKNEWCAGVCDSSFSIASVTSTTLVLQDAQPQHLRGDTIKNSISRVSGEWYFYRSLPKIGFNRTVKGKCAVAPFSGFPTRKF